MKRKILVLLISTLFITNVFAQITVNPQDRFYEDAQNWAIKGIVDNLPPLRPYTMQECQRILNQVIENGSYDDMEIAREYLNQFESKIPSIGLTIEADGKLGTQGFSKNLSGKVGATGDISFIKNLFSYGYDVGFVGRTKSNLSDFNPLFSNYSCDARFDPATIGPLLSYFDVNTNFGFSYNGFFVQAGINRVGYGDFLNYGITLNDSAYHMPVMSVSYVNNFLSYTQLMAVIGATKNQITDSWVYPNKFLGFHALEFKPIKKLSFSIYENVIYGNKFDFSYLIPTPFMICQSFSGYDSDSIMMGVRGSFTPIKGLKISSDLLVDDIAVNDIVKFNFDTRIRIAWANEVKYVFDNPVISSVGLNYTIITPFTYTHMDCENHDHNQVTSNTINYQNYTNSGFAIGSQYAPNSDVIRLNVRLTPIKKLNIDIEGSFLRHGNVSESLTPEECMGYLLSDYGTYSTDGSIFDHQFGGIPYKADGTYNGSDYENDFLPTALNHLNFLTQDNLMLVATGKINVDYNIAVYKKLKVYVNAGYSFEYVHNKGVDTNMFNGGDVSINIDGTITYNKGNGSKTTTNPHDYTEVVNFYKNQWKQQLHDEFNNYFSIGVTVKW